MPGRVFRVAVLGLLTGLLGAMTPVDSRAGEQQAGPVAAVLHVSQSKTMRPMRFDWLASRRDPAQIVLAAETRTPRQIGKGSWICSPAGFGKKSSCYAN